MAISYIASPLSGYFGAKGRMLGKILPLIPKNHDYFLELFGGGGPVTLNKSPAKIKDIYNDRDTRAVSVLKTVADPDLFDIFLERVLMGLWSRQEFIEGRRIVMSAKKFSKLPLVEQAALYFHMVAMTFSGDMAGMSWSFSTGSSGGNMPLNMRRRFNTLRHLPLCHKRLQQVEITNLDFRKALKASKWTRKSVVYADPPYLSDTRKQGGYFIEMTEEDHKDLLRLLDNFPGKVILSGYAHPLYDKFLSRKGWQRIDEAAYCFSVGTTRETKLTRRDTGGDISAAEKGQRIESLWVKKPL